MLSLIVLIRVFFKVTVRFFKRNKSHLLTNTMLRICVCTRKVKLLSE